MAISVGDPNAVQSFGTGHSGGETPSFVEALTHGQWDGLANTSETYGIQYAVQIQTDATSGDAARGLFLDTDDSKYYFRWVTGRPEFDGVTVIPTGENEGDVWAEGIVVGREGLGSVDRMIDIIKTGDYGSLSGYNFTITNHDNFHEFLDTEEIFLINRTIKFYVVLDNVFYQIWGGVVSETKFTEQVFSFICEDIFKTAHKTIPKTVITNVLFPGARKESLGKTIPVSFGDILRAPLIPLVVTPGAAPSESVIIAVTINPVISIISPYTKLTESVESVRETKPPTDIPVTLPNVAAACN